MTPTLPKMSSSRCDMFYDEAVQLCSQAVTADDASQREKAVAYYIASCDYFVAGYRCDLSITRKKLILTRVRNFIARAEMLRTSLRTRSAPTSSKEVSRRETSLAVSSEWDSFAFATCS